jgi:hypothetical protein
MIPFLMCLLATRSRSVAIIYAQKARHIAPSRAQVQGGRSVNSAIANPGSVAVGIVTRPSVTIQICCETALITAQGIWQ